MRFAVEHKIPASAVAVQNVLNEIIGALRGQACACGDLGEIKLALQEALINALSHGSAGAGDKTITVRASCDETEGLHIVVRDEGPGFAPDAVPDPTAPENLKKEGGRGLYLMREMMDEVEFRDGGREVHLRRRPRPPEPAQ